MKQFDLLKLRGVTEGVKVRKMTKNLVSNLIWDLPLTLPQCVDFGVQSGAHYRGLRDALANIPAGADLISDAESRKHFADRVKELDQALGNGPKITAFVRKYAPNYKLEFETLFDALPEHLFDE